MREIYKRLIKKSDRSLYRRLANERFFGSDRFFSSCHCEGGVGKN